jgi:NTE family protein
MKCNLVLSGGGVRGYAHIGVIKALLEKGVKIKAISGTSSGALVGAFICDGFQPQEIEEILAKTNPKISFNLLRLKDSLLSFQSYTNTINKYLRSKRFEELKIPLFISATNLISGKQHIFNKGKIEEALIASAAIPVLFPPVIINKIPYADGGMSNNLPTEPFEGSKTKLIGIHVNPVSNYEKHSGLLHQADRSMHMIVRNNILYSISKCDLFIEPPGLKEYAVLEKGRIGEIIKTGYDYIMKEFDLSQLKK